MKLLYLIAAQIVFIILNLVSFDSVLVKQLVFKPSDHVPNHWVNPFDVLLDMSCVAYVR